MPTTVGRSRGRQGVHSGAQGAAGDHMRKIMASLIAAIAVIIFVLVVTKAGHTIDAATQHFMLYYAGVLALVGLTGSVLMGLVATDRVVMTPGHRVMAQAVHRAFAFGTLAFLIIHITTEILAQRSHVIDAAIPFLSPYRTFYIGLGTIASDLILLLVVTGILRKRFTGHGRAWQWRAIHYSSYVAFVFGVLHGLLGGRAAKPYVDWSYGFAIAVTALGLAVRFLAISLRPKESLGSSPSARPRQALGFFAAARRGHAHGAVTARRDGPGAARRHGRAGAPPSARRAQARGPRFRRLAGPHPRARCRPWIQLRPTPGRSAVRRLPRPRVHAARRPAVRRRYSERDAGPPLPGRGPAAVGAGRTRARLRVPRGSRSTSRGMTGRHGSRVRRGDTATCLRTNCPPTRTDRRAVGRSLRRRMSTTTRTVPGRLGPTGGPVRGPAGRSPRVPGRPYPHPPVRRTGARGRCQRSGPARCPSSERGQCPGPTRRRCPGLKGRRCPGLIPARFRGSAMARCRATVRARCRAMAPARCRARVRDPCRVPTRVRCRERARARCRAPTPARCHSSGRGRCPGLIPARFRGPATARRRVTVRARCHATAPARCHARVRDPCRGSGRGRCPGPTRRRCPGPKGRRCPGLTRR